MWPLPLILAVLVGLRAHKHAVSRTLRAPADTKCPARSGSWSPLGPQTGTGAATHTPGPIDSRQGGKGVQAGRASALDSTAQTQNPMSTNWPQRSVATQAHAHMHAHTRLSRKSAGLGAYDPQTPVIDWGSSDNTQTRGRGAGQGGCCTHVYTCTHALGCPHVSSMCRWHACWCACGITPAAIYVRGRGGSTAGEGQGHQGLTGGDRGLPGSVLGVSLEQGME